MSFTRRQQQQAAADNDEASRDENVDDEHVAQMLRKELRDKIAWKQFKKTMRAFRCEIFLYVMFLFFISASVIMSRESKYDIQLVTQLRIALLDTEIPTEKFPMTFAGLGNADDFWAWFEGVFVPVVFDAANPTYQYCLKAGTYSEAEVSQGNVTITADDVGSKDDAGVVCYDQGFIMGTSILAGPVRVRQVRVQKEDCPSSTNDLSRTFFSQGCFPKYSSSTVEQTTFVRAANRMAEGAESIDGATQNFSTSVPARDQGLIVSTTTKAFEFGDLTPEKLSVQQEGWTYSTSTDLNLKTMAAWLETYEGGGFTVRLPRGRDSSLFLSEVNILKNTGWIDMATRSIIIDFVAYNAALNQFVTVDIYVEFMPSGGVVPFADIRVAKLWRYPNNIDGHLTAVFDIASVVLVFYFLGAELWELYKEGWKYWSFWNVLDLLVYSLFIVAYGLLLSIVVEFPPASPSLTNPVDYTSHFLYAYRHRVFTRIVAINVFLVWFKVFKYTTFVPGLMVVTKTLEKSVKATFSFVILFALVLVGFAFFGMIAFGENLEGYQSFGESFSTLLLALLGAMDFHELRVVDRTLGPIYFFLFTVVSIFVLLSMFFAILAEAYDAAKNSKHRVDIGKQLYRDLKYSNFGQKRIKWLDRIQASTKRIFESEEALLDLKDMERVVAENRASVDAVYGKTATARDILKRYGIRPELPDRKLQERLLNQLDDNLPSSDEESDIDDSEKIMNQLRILRRHVRIIHARLNIMPIGKRGKGASAKNVDQAFQARDEAVLRAAEERARLQALLMSSESEDGGHDPLDDTQDTLDDTHDTLDDTQDLAQTTQETEDTQDTAPGTPSTTGAASQPATSPDSAKEAAYSGENGAYSGENGAYSGENGAYSASYSADAGAEATTQPTTTTVGGSGSGSGSGSGGGSGASASASGVASASGSGSGDDV